MHLNHLSIAVLTGLVLVSCHTNTDFSIGADISEVPANEARGGKYYDADGNAADICDIMKENGFDIIRLRIFVNPEAERGYSRDGFCGTESTIAFAKRIIASGMDFALDFHYSDTWADPGKQFKPASWARDNGSALEGRVYSYSKETVERFIAEGVKPDMVHIACGGNNEESVKFFDKILSRDVKFDVIGQSYYPEWHGTPDDLRNNLNDLAARYHKPIVVVEYQEHRREVNEIVASLPDNLGLGTFIWEATSPRWGNLFDKDGATNGNMALYPEIAGLYAK